MDKWDLLIKDWEDFFDATHGRGGSRPNWKDVWEMWIRGIPTSELQDAMTCYNAHKHIASSNWIMDTSFFYHFENALVERLLLGDGE